MKDVIKAVCIIIGTMIGAGFASGREIYIFFNIYGIAGVLGIFISSIIMGFVIYKVLKHIRNIEVENYKQYLECIGVNNKVREVFSIIINIFLLVSFYIMIAGFCTYFKQEFNISPYLIGIIVAFLCYFTFLNKIDGVTKINTILIPILIGVVILIGIKNGFGGIEDFVNNAQMQQNKSGIGWLISSVEYASYNTILLIPILIGIKKYSRGKEAKISILSSSLFFILAIILYSIILGGGEYISSIELPIIYIVNKFGGIYPYLCGTVIIAAIFTTAISAGYGFLQNSTKSKKTYKALAGLICITSVFTIKLGFSYLVNLMYPMFGFLSFIQIIYILTRKIET